MSDGLTVRDVLQVAQRALMKGTENQEQIDELREKQEELVEDVTAIKLRQSEMDEERPYQALSTDEKVGMVREHAFQRAVSGHGKATLDYNDVMWSVSMGSPARSTPTSSCGLPLGSMPRATAPRRSPASRFSTIGR